MWPTNVMITDIMYMNAFIYMHKMVEISQIYKLRRSRGPAQLPRVARAPRAAVAAHASVVVYDRIDFKYRKTTSTYPTAEPDSCYNPDHSVWC